MEVTFKHVLSKTIKMESKAAKEGICPSLFKGAMNSYESSPMMDCSRLFRMINM